GGRAPLELRMPTAADRAAVRTKARGVAPAPVVSADSPRAASTIDLVVQWGSPEGAYCAGVTSIWTALGVSPYLWLVHKLLHSRQASRIQSCNQTVTRSRHAPAVHQGR